MEPAEFLRQASFVFDGGDPLEFGLEGGGSEGVDARFIHARCPIITHLLFDGRAVRRGLGVLLGNLVQNIAIVLLQFIEAAPGRLVGRNGIVLQPGAASVLIEIGARAYRPVDRAGIESR